MVGRWPIVYSSSELWNNEFSSSFWRYNNPRSDGKFDATFGCELHIILEQTPMLSVDEHCHDDAMYFTRRMNHGILRAIANDDAMTKHTEKPAMFLNATMFISQLVTCNISAQLSDSP